MGSSDNFCLRWNDFEANISSSFRELRQASEFFDVTLCCDNGKDVVQAHKVILAACSPFFRRILSHSKTQQNPFLYLKGIKQEELLAVLNFMYHGEVNIAQDSLNSFLSAAEELSVKGLTTNDTNTSKSSKKGGAVGGSSTAYYDDEENVESDDDTIRKRSHAKKGSGKKTSGSGFPGKRKVDVNEHDEDHDLKRIKAEPDPIGHDDHGGDDDYDVGGAEGVNEEDDYDSFNQFDLDESGSAGPSGGRAHNESKGTHVEAKFAKTRHGNALLMDPHGFCYSWNHKGKKRIYWVCNKVSKFKCRASASTEGFFIVRLSGAHTHSPDDSGGLELDTNDVTVPADAVDEDKKQKLEESKK